MQLSASDLEIIRKKPQSTEVYLSIFQPQTVMACVISGTVSQGARTIPYKDVSSGGYLSVEAGMTLLVGTSAGGRELGKIRIRSVNAGEFTVAENSNINWASATHLTVLRYWEVWPIYPRIINDPNNVDNVIFYKDWDITYTNQNTVLGAFPCAGTHRAGFVGDSFYYSSTGTTHLLGSGLTYDWSFEGGSVTGSTSADPGYITYNTPGHYVTRLIVTGANGSVDTTYRYVSIYNRPSESNTNIPITKFSFDNLAGSRSEGGYNANVQITDSPVDLHDGDIVILFKEDYYGSTKASLGGNSPNNSSILFVGGIAQNSIHYDYQSSDTDFQVVSVSDIMKSSEGFSVSVEAHASPTKWFQLLDMDGRRAIYHYLKWHTTVLFTTDFEFRGTDQKIQYFDSDRQSMFDAIDNYMRGTLVGSLCSDRQGKLWAEVGAVVYSNPTGSFPPVMEITDRDWMGRPTITERLTPPLSFLEMGGVAYSGTSTGTFSALISCAPGDTPNTRGNVERQQGLALASQQQLNILTGNLFANKNATFPAIEIELSGNYGNLDIAPQETVDVNIPSGSTTRNIPIHAPYIVDSMSWRYSSLGRLLIPQIGLTSLVTSISTGTTITIPEVPDGGGYGGFSSGFNFTGFGGFPPFLSSLVAPTYGRWTSDILNEDEIQGMNFNGQSYNYGIATYNGTTGSSPISTIMVLNSGIYLVVIEVICNTTVATAFSAKVRFMINGSPTNPQTIHYYPANSGIAMQAVGYVVLTAGQTVNSDLVFNSAITLTTQSASMTLSYIRPLT